MEDLLDALAVASAGDARGVLAVCAGILMTVGLLATAMVLTLAGSALWCFAFAGIGWAVATLEFRPDPAPFQTWVEIADWGCLPGADAALFALFAGYASMNGMVAWSGPDPDPAALYALRDRFARLTDRWHWMLRLVDLPAALQARPWPSGVAGEVDVVAGEDSLSDEAQQLVRDTGPLVAMPRRVLAVAASMVVPGRNRPSK